MAKFLLVFVIAFTLGKNIWVYPHESGVSFGFGSLGYNIASDTLGVY